MTAPTEEGTVELPKLPVAVSHRWIGDDAESAFSVDQMQAYARAAVLADRASRSPVVGAVGGEPKPLTEERIDAVVEKLFPPPDVGVGYHRAWLREIAVPIARAIEAAHGIGVSPTGSPEGEVSK